MVKERLMPKFQYLGKSCDEMSREELIECCIRGWESYNKVNRELMEEKHRSIEDLVYFRKLKDLNNVVGTNYPV